MESIFWQIRRFSELTTLELYDILRLRCDVFVVEQDCPYPELDGRDLHPRALHVTGRCEDGPLAAYLRILPPGVTYPDVSFGRVVVAGSYRKKGLSHALVKNALTAIAREWPGKPVTIGAQEYLLKFYESHGFIPISGVYLEDGIPHIDMTRNQA